jgi:hypothetical protein
MTATPRDILRTSAFSSASVRVTDEIELVDE